MTKNIIDQLIEFVHCSDGKVLNLSSSSELKSVLNCLSFEAFNSVVEDSVSCSKSMGSLTNSESQLTNIAYGDGPGIIKISDETHRISSYQESIMSTTHSEMAKISKYSELLQYLFYAGCACIRLSQYRDAFLFFHLCITLPCSSVPLNQFSMTSSSSHSSSQVSNISIIAYKKYTLVSLILYGKLIPLPKCTTSVVAISIKQSCRNYEEFSTLLSTENVVERFHKVKEEFRQDRNLELAKRAVHAIYLFALIELESSFLNLKLQDAVVYLHLPRDSPQVLDQSMQLIKQYLFYLSQDEDENNANENSALEFKQATDAELVSFPKTKMKRLYSYVSENDMVIHFQPRPQPNISAVKTSNFIERSLELEKSLNRRADLMENKLVELNRLKDVLFDLQKELTLDMAIQLSKKPTNVTTPSASTAVSDSNNNNNDY